MKEISEILSGETASLECKLASGGLPASLWESFSAFANTYGGTIILGIKESKGKFSVQGVENASRKSDHSFRTPLLITLKKPPTIFSTTTAVV